MTRGSAAQCGASGQRTAVAGKLADVADVLRMLDRLPLNDDERAEAVRRLLADRSS